jgi:hypothetical protein
VRDPGFSSFFLSSAADRPPLRIAILLDHQVDRATASILDDILAADFLAPVTVMVEVAAPGPARRTLLDRLNRLAWDVYRRLDRGRVTLADDPAAPVDRDAALGRFAIVPRTVRPIPGGTVRRLPPDAVETLRAAGPDVVLQLGMTDVELPSEVASFGCWVLRPGDGARYTGDPPHFWEMVDGDAITTVILERRADGTPGTPGTPLVLASARFATDMMSLARNRVMPAYGSTFLVLRALWTLHGFGWARLAARARPVSSVGPRSRRGGLPSNGVVLRWLLPRAIAAVRRRLARRFRSGDVIEHWQMAIRTGGRGLSLDGSPDLSGFRWIESPKGRFYADPFLVERDGRTWLFFEDYGYAEARGVISRAAVGPEGELGAPSVVLSTEGHLSYPYVFVGGDAAWMIPESSAEGAVRLYRATAFPDEWAVHAELLPMPALDTSVWRDAERWWLFASLREPRGGATMLWLFSAEALTGPWTGHPMNPISTDVRTARSAGLIHRRDGRLLRPSQDGSRGYGSSFGLNEITVLTPTDYEERPVVTVAPDWAPDMLATHTYNQSGSIEVVDGKFRRARDEVR